MSREEVLVITDRRGVGLQSSGCHSTFPDNLLQGENTRTLCFVGRVVTFVLKSEGTDGGGRNPQGLKSDTGYGLMWMSVQQDPVPSLFVEEVPDSLPKQSILKSPGPTRQSHLHTGWVTGVSVVYLFVYRNMSTNSPDPVPQWTTRQFRKLRGSHTPSCVPLSGVEDSRVHRCLFSHRSLSSVSVRGLLSSRIRVNDLRRPVIVLNIFKT